MVEVVFVLRKGAQLGSAASEMEAAGFTQFMEVGVPYEYTTACDDDTSKTTTAEATVTSYEIFDSADGYPAMEGYEWRVVKMEVRFYDENFNNYNCLFGYCWEDYYNTKLHEDSEELLEEADGYDLYANTIIHNGQEMEMYTYDSFAWGEWYTNDAGSYEIIGYVQLDFLVPIGYDGCVAGLRDRRVEWLDDTCITDYDPAAFLLFRAK